MAYSQDMRTAARRHLRAAQTLYDQVGPSLQPGCMAVAGYLFGLAGELAVKELMRDSGMRPLPTPDRHDDPFFVHFPVLKTMLATAKGRRAGELRTFSEDPRLFQNWDIAMRYAPTKDIDANWVETWKVSAERLIDRMETVLRVLSLVMLNSEIVPAPAFVT
jgi:hypothetical protein